ncbi:Imm1 family immunity protein [Actinokineospora sp.]|uniref:Imm1 family immunity protein n=1 Tax=Actinokineospora sp. TaxID=1872133 RepID=UPI0040382BBA
MIPSILEVSFINVDDLTGNDDLVSAVRELNAGGVEIPWAWCISAGPTDPLSSDRRTLTIGVNNTVGVLVWSPGRGRQVPQAGANPEWSTYYLAGMYDTSIPPNAEVPPETVYEALAEFLDTRSLPTCIEWQRAVDPA